MGQANYQIIDGAVVTSKNERNLDCVITFQTLSVLQRFMLRFERLKIDCNDHLYIYDVANAVGSFKVGICITTANSPLTSIQLVGIIYEMYSQLSNSYFHHARLRIIGRFDLSQYDRGVRCNVHER